MHELNDAQWDELRKLHALAALADMETDAALYSGDLADATAAIQALATAADALSLQNGLAKDLQRLALEALQATDGGGDTKVRASDAMQAVDALEQVIEARFAGAKRRL